MIPTEWLDLDNNHIKMVKFVPNKHDLRGDMHVQYASGKEYKFKDVQMFKVEKMVHANKPAEVFFNEIRGMYDSEFVGMCK